VTGVQTCALPIKAPDSEAFIFLLSIRWVQTSVCIVGRLLMSNGWGSDSGGDYATEALHARGKRSIQTPGTLPVSELAVSQPPGLPHSLASRCSAAGRGLNLQSSDTVVIYDPDPNPKNEEQAIARWVALMYRLHTNLASARPLVLYDWSCWPAPVAMHHWQLATHSPSHTPTRPQLAPHRPEEGGAGHPPGVGGRCAVLGMLSVLCCGQWRTRAAPRLLPASSGCKT